MDLGESLFCRDELAGQRGQRGGDLGEAGADVGRRGTGFAAAVGVTGVGAGHGVPEIALDPGQDGGRIQWRLMPWVATQGRWRPIRTLQMVISPGGDRPPVGVPQQLPVRLGVALPAVLD